MFANHVFVVDRNLKPLKPCLPEVARILQKVGKAHRFRLYPFTIRLNKEVNQEITPFLTLKIDPGSKFTGLALLDGDSVIWGMELEHRGSEISQSLLKRSAVRRSRRNRQTRYRKWRKHHRPEGWLAPSLQHRVDTVSTWVRRLIKLTPIKEICLELVRFDLQKIENPEISGVEYQQGELFGYEVKQYLLEKWGRKCAYCDAENIPLEVDRIHPKSKGGTDRVANLTLACRACNQAKGNEDIKDFLSGKPDRLKKVLTGAKQPLKDASAVNSTRWALFNALKETELPVSTGSGGLTKFNRTRLGLPKTHWLDATCVGAIEGLKLLTHQPLRVKCNGHGNRQFVTMDKYGFPRQGYAPKTVRKDYKAGDIVRYRIDENTSVLARIRKAAKQVVAVVQGKDKTVSNKNEFPVHRSDGYRYQFTPIDSDLYRFLAT